MFYHTFGECRDSWSWGVGEGSDLGRPSVVSVAGSEYAATAFGLWFRRSGASRKRLVSGSRNDGMTESEEGSLTNITVATERLAHPRCIVFGIVYEGQALGRRSSVVGRPHLICLGPSVIFDFRRPGWRGLWGRRCRFGGVFGGGWRRRFRGGSGSCGRGRGWLRG